MHTLVSVSITRIVFSWSAFAYYIVFHPFTFNLFISLYLECFSCRQNIAVSYFLIQSDRPCFSSTMFKCLIFNAIIYNLGIIPTIVMGFFLFISFHLCSLLLLFLFCCGLVGYIYYPTLSTVMAFYFFTTFNKIICILNLQYTTSGKSQSLKIV